MCVALALCLDGRIGRRGALAFKYLLWFRAIYLVCCLRYVVLLSYLFHTVSIRLLYSICTYTILVLYFSCS
jgi:hypothetical protein